MDRWERRQNEEESSIELVYWLLDFNVDEKLLNFIEFLVPQSSIKPKSHLVTHIHVLSVKNDSHYPLSNKRRQEKKN